MHHSEKQKSFQTNYLISRFLFPDSSLFPSLICYSIVSIFLTSWKMMPVRIWSVSFKEMALLGASRDNIRIMKTWLYVPILSLRALGKLLNISGSPFPDQCKEKFGLRDSRSRPTGNILQVYEFWVFYLKKNCKKPHKMTIFIIFRFTLQ